MSENLKAFLRAWLDWVEAGAVHEKPFDKRVGLCTNFRRSTFVDRDGRSDLNELAVAFVVDGLDGDYPFGGEDQYADEQSEYRMHLNPTRLAWVRSKVGQVAEA